MIVKMIQNLENKMELNSLQTRIEKMQEMFNKDLEKIKKSQSIMNNAINEIKNTLEGTNSSLLRARTNNFTICMEIQKTSNSQSDLEKDLRSDQGGLRVSSPSGERKDACGLRKWCKLLVLKFYWSPA